MVLMNKNNRIAVEMDRHERLKSEYFYSREILLIAKNPICYV
jgi:hypothetical protein